MRFHLPQPLHGWRALIGEVGIIVVGVLIALAAQQAAEWWHWRDQVADIRRALDREVANNLGAIAMREKEGPCIDRRLREIRSLLATPGFGAKSRAPLGQPQLFRPGTNVWQAA